MTVKRLKIRLLTPPEDVSWGRRYIATALGHRGFQIIEPHEGSIAVEESGLPVHSVLWSSWDHLYLGSDGKVVVLDESLKKKTEFSVPTQVESLYETKDKKILAAGDGWIATVSEKGLEIGDIGYTAWKIAGKGNLAAVGTKEGRLLIVALDSMNVLWSADLQAPVTGLDWGPALVAGNASGDLYVVVRKEDAFELRLVEKYKGISDLSWNPKGDELAALLSMEREIKFLTQTFADIESIRLESVPIALDYSPTSIEVAVALENGELVSVATPKVAKLVSDLLVSSGCEKEGKVVCKALERALWKIIGELAPDVNVDEFYALKQLGENMIDSLACLNEHLESIRKVLKSVASLEDVVEALKGGCSRLERWLEMVVKNADCIVELSERLDQLFELASADLLAAQAPTSVHLAETLGCDKALELVECATEVYRGLKKLQEAEEELGISLPVPGETILYLFINDECEEIREGVRKLMELYSRALAEAKEGNVGEVLKIVREAEKVARALKDKVEEALPEGIVES